MSNMNDFSYRKQLLKDKVLEYTNSYDTEGFYNVREELLKIINIITPVTEPVEVTCTLKDFYNNFVDDYILYDALTYYIFKSVNKYILEVDPIKTEMICEFLLYCGTSEELYNSILNKVSVESYLHNKNYRRDNQLTKVSGYESLPNF